jgi:hypothetical protein
MTPVCLRLRKDCGSAATRRNALPAGQLFNDISRCENANLQALTISWQDIGGISR